jgi:abortive infection bacteriophage resistance protein
MPKPSFDKPHFTHDKHVELLVERGLSIPNQEQAKYFLSSVGYYRLSGYWHPFLKEPKKAHKFKDGAVFDSAMDLYVFDSLLRKIISSEIEKVEIALRSQIIYVLSGEHGLFWHTTASLFSDHNKYSSVFESLDKEFKRSDEEFLRAYRKKYGTDMPANWIVMEVSSFGTLSRLFGNLKPFSRKEEYQNIMD